MWKEKVSLQAGQTLKLIDSRERGNLGQTEIENWSVLDEAGQQVGTVRYTHTTDIKAPFHRSSHLVQLDSAGATVLDTRWDG